MGTALPAAVTPRVLVTPKQTSPSEADAKVTVIRATIPFGIELKFKLDARRE